jgi:outer membrane protein assembly factor BamB
LAIVAAIGLTGCELPNWLGGSDEDVPLPGERVAVLAFDRSFNPDPEIADLQVELPAATVNETWEQQGGSATRAMNHLALGPQPKTVWQAKVGDGTGDDRMILAQPIVTGDRVFTMDSRSIVTAFEVLSGREVWQVDLKPEGEDEGYFGGGLAYESDRIYVTTGFAQVFALDASNGSVVWQQAVRGPIHAAPTVADGRVFAITVGNQLSVLAADDGRSLWTHNGIQEIAELLGSASPAVSGSVAVVPYSSGELFGLLVENGHELWNDSLASLDRFDPITNLAHIRGLPVIDRGLVLAIGNAGRMVAIDIRRGARAWDITLGGVEMPWVGGDFVFVLTNDAKVVCLTRRDGRVRWALALERYGDPEELEDPIVWLGPVLAGDRLIVVGSNRQALSISPYTGELLGSVDLPGAPAVAPVVAKEMLFVLTEDANLIAMR